MNRPTPTSDGDLRFDGNPSLPGLLAEYYKFDDFVYWNYSGAPPGAGESEGEAEPPRWRSSAFLAVSTADAATVIRVAFLARSAELDPVTNVYLNPLDGIYLATGPGQGPIMTVIETGTDGTVLDSEAVWDDDENPATSFRVVVFPSTSDDEEFRADRRGDRAPDRSAAAPRTIL